MKVLKPEVQQARTAKDPEAFVASLQGQPWAHGVMQVRIVSRQPGLTPTGRVRFVIGVTIIEEA